MKEIQPITILNQKATLLNISIIQDDLKESAIFYYQVKNDNLQIVASGNIDIVGLDYENWTNNEYAWNFVADKLGLKIIN